MKLKVSNVGDRLDSYLISVLDKSRSKIQSMIKNGNILVNGNVVKSSYIVKENDEIDVTDVVEEVISAAPEKMDLDIVYEDDDVIVVNKANGIVVHPAVGNTSGTLVNGLMYHSNSLSSVNGSFRPGIVHRIDRDTTGLLMVAKNDKAHEILAKQLEEKKTRRVYWALVWGVIKEDTGTIDAPIGRDSNDRKKMAVTASNSKHAVTHFKVLERYKNATLIELNLETGRTHQIRVHMNYIGHPVVNDPMYGKKKLINDYGQMLHAEYLGFNHPITGKFMEFTAEPEKEFNDILDQFRNS